MTDWVRAHLFAVALAGSLVLAGGSGFLTATALGVGAQQATRTVTVEIPAGPSGPRGPTGQAGPPGLQGPTGVSGQLECPVGFSAAYVVFPQQGKGPTTIYACTKE